MRLFKRGIEMQSFNSDVAYDIHSLTEIYLNMRYSEEDLGPRTMFYFCTDTSTHLYEDLPENKEVIETLKTFKNDAFRIKIWTKREYCSKDVVFDTEQLTK